jgi:hypothetical protein
MLNRGRHRGFSAESSRRECRQGDCCSEHVMRRAKAAIQNLALLAAIFMAVPTASADRLPVRRGVEVDQSRRRGIDDGRVGRRPIEGEQGKTQVQKEQETRRKQSTKVMNLVTPMKCGATASPKFKKFIIRMQSPDSSKFYLELWGNRQVFYVYDSIYYFLRSNRDAYVTMFWIGPEGSVFIPFSNVKIESERDHKLDPSNIIVEPVGLERWRAIATPTPHHLPCRATDVEFVAALKKLQSKHRWAAARWDVRSKVYRKKRRWKRSRW